MKKSICFFLSSLFFVVSIGTSADDYLGLDCQLHNDPDGNVAQLFNTENYTPPSHTVTEISFSFLPGFDKVIYICGIAFVGADNVPDESLQEKTRLFWENFSQCSPLLFGKMRRTNSAVIVIPEHTPYEEQKIITDHGESNKYSLKLLPLGDEKPVDILYMAEALIESHILDCTGQFDVRDNINLPEDKMKLSSELKEELITTHSLAPEFYDEDDITIEMISEMFAFTWLSYNNLFTGMHSIRIVHGVKNSRLRGCIKAVFRSKLFKTSLLSSLSCPYNLCAYPTAQDMKKHCPETIKYMTETMGLRSPNPQ